MSLDPVSSSRSSTRTFRVIIAGAGVSGLVISHALAGANIDHVVLEKGVVAPAWGASISIWAHGARILQQIGCWGAIRAAGVPLKSIHMRDGQGRAYSAEAFFDMMTERNGYEYATLERRKFLKILYENHPSPERILERKKVIDIVETDDGVCVQLEDGTVEEGDILIGSDGVHSTVRELMWKNANHQVPDLITAREKTSLETTYRALVGVARPVPGMAFGEMHWITHWGMSFLILTQPSETFFFVNWKLPQKSVWPSKAKWGDLEAEGVAASIAHLPITGSAVFGELWKNKIRGHLIGLQEGTFDHWSFGRVVLVGDSVHKVTPNLALGAMCAMESSAVMVNKIKSMVDGLERGQRPPHDLIRAMLSDYQAERMPRQKEASEASAFLTRLHAYDGVVKWFIMRWIIPTFGQARIADTMADFCSRAPKISFLPLEYARTATFKWQDELDHIPATPNHAILGQRFRDTKPAMLHVAVFVMSLLVYAIFCADSRSIVMSTVNTAPFEDATLSL